MWPKSRRIVEDWAVAPDQHHVALLLDCVLCRAVPFSTARSHRFGILAYGAIAATIIGLLGPIFIPFLVFDKLDWLFWDGSRRISDSALQGHCRRHDERSIPRSDELLHPAWPEHCRPVNDCSDVALLILLVLVNVYILFKIPSMSHSLFGGSGGGHGGLTTALMAARAIL